MGATASSGPFAPSGVVNVTDNRGGSCTLTLLPVLAPLTSEGTCVLADSGATDGANLTIANSIYPLRTEFFKADGDEGRDFLGLTAGAATDVHQHETNSRTGAPHSMPLTR